MSIRTGASPRGMFVRVALGLRENQPAKVVYLAWGDCLTPYKMKVPEQVANWRDWRRLTVFLRPYSGRLVFILAVSMAATCLSLVQPFMSKLLIDNALLKRDMRALVMVAGLMFVATVLGYALNIASSYHYAEVSAAMLFDMRAALFRHLQTLSPRFYASFRLGDLMSRLNNDVGEVQRVSADTLLSVLSNIVFLVGSIATMLWLNWKLFLLGVVFVPGAVYAFARYQRRLTTLTRKLRERSADLGSLFVESILGMRVVVSLRANEHEVSRFRAKNDEFVSTMLQVQLASFLTGALPGTILTAATTAVFLYGGWLIFHDRMTIGTMVAFMAYQARLLSPIQNLMGMSAGLATARVSLGRIFELLDTPAEVREAADPVSLDTVEGGFLLEDVSIRFDRNPVLEHVSLEIPARSICAILGATGAGKSTLADLLVRYLDPDQGCVRLDGKDLRQISLPDLRKNVMLVDQSPYLFHASIAENIAFALPGATSAQIEQAGKAAGLEELIRRLPEGYKTKTGERGLALSAGEQQRVALARALLRQPSVLILDEPSSALDEETERLVASNLRSALPNATLIVITHRPALAAIADCVIEIDSARAVMTSRKPHAALRS